MSTLAEQIKSDYDDLVVTPHYEDTELVRVSELTAAKLIRYGANDSGNDDAAVELGLDYMVFLVQKRFQLVSDETAISESKRLLAEFEDFRAGRIQEASTPVASDDDDAS